MYKKRCLRMCFFDSLYLCGADVSMDMAVAIIKKKLFFRHLFCDETSQIFVWDKKDMLIRKRTDNLYRIR